MRANRHSTQKDDVNFQQSHWSNSKFRAVTQGSFSQMKVSLGYEIIVIKICPIFPVEVAKSLGKIVTELILFFFLVIQLGFRCRRGKKLLPSLSFTGCPESLVYFEKPISQLFVHINMPSVSFCQKLITILLVEAFLKIIPIVTMTVCLKVCGHLFSWLLH